MDNEQLITSTQMEEALLRIQNKFENVAGTEDLQEQITANAQNIESISTQLTSKADSSALTDGSVTKLGTATVGGSANPIYLSSGTATACSSTVGSATQPIYMSSGTMTACNTTVGGSAKPIYSSSGVLTACSSTVGSGTQPVYMSSGTITACGTTVGSGTKPIYSSSGVLTASSSTVGSGVIPVYLSSGTITASSSTVGSGTKPIYLSSGTLTVSSSTVGSGTKPVYLSSGTVTASSSTVGGSSTPVYLSSGTVTACSKIAIPIWYTFTTSGSGSLTSQIDSLSSSTAYMGFANGYSSSSELDMPTSNYYYVLVWKYSDSYAKILALSGGSRTTTTMYVRNLYGGTWGSWTSVT